MIEPKDIRVVQDSVTDYYHAYVGNKEVAKAKTLVKCIKSLLGYIKGQAC